MAWVTEYDLRWTSPTTPVSWGYIYLQRDEASYIGPLTLKGDSLEIRNGFDSWDDPVARMNCSFTIINDLSDFYELLPLMTTALGQVKVVVTNESADSGNPIHIFEGFLNCETVNQTMLWKSPITLTASGYLSKLQNEYPASVDTLDYNSLINTIIDCIALTGSTDPIRVNISLYENNSAPGAGQTVFNRIDSFQEVWWVNNFERMSALDILRGILTSFDCYLFWYNQYWYIRHYQDLGTAYPDPVPFVEYALDTSAGYSYADTGTPYQDWFVAFDIHNQQYYRQIGNTQTLNVIPGVRTMDIKLNAKQYFNLFYPDLAQLEGKYSGDPTPALTSRREWWAYYVPPTTMYWEKWGLPFRNIENSVFRYGDDLTIVGYDATEGMTYGLSQRFNLTADWNTALKIQFKFGVTNLTYLSSAPLPPEDISITFYYYLCTYDEVEANRDYIYFDVTSSADEGTWTMVANGDPTVNYNTVEISMADMDHSLFTYQASVDIPIGSIDGIVSSSGAEADMDLIFCLGTEVIRAAANPDKAANSCYYGDIVATVSEAPAYNLLEGKITTDFIEKKEISMELFDAGWSYRNSLFRYVNQYYNTIAEDWTYDGVTIQELQEWLLSTKFRLNRIARQKISMDVYTTILPAFELLWPWYDSKQSDLPFTILSQIIKPQSNTISIELYEYDDAETITLIES